MQYNVSFGSAFAIDQFGFVRKGTVTTEPDTVVFSGKKSWSTLAKVMTLLLISVVPFILFRVGVGILVGLVVIHYFCASNGSLAIRKASIGDVPRKRRKIKFSGTHPESGKKKNTVFKVDTESNAASLEKELRGG